MLEFINEINIIAILVCVIAIICALRGQMDWIVAILFILSTFSFKIHLRARGG